MNLQDIYRRLLEHRERTGTPAFLLPLVEKAYELARFKRYPRCRQGAVSWNADDRGHRTYSCNLCPWRGWLPVNLIELPSVTEDFLAFVLAKYYP